MRSTNGSSRRQSAHASLGRSAGRSAISARRSTVSLRQPSPTPVSHGSLADALGGGDPGGSDYSAPGASHFSLAHELAAALMPEPSAGSKLLADEFGIEFDEGAEGIEQEDDPALVPAVEVNPPPPSFKEVRSISSMSRYIDEDDEEEEDGTAGRRTPTAGFLAESDDDSLARTPPTRQPPLPISAAKRSPRPPLEQFTDDMAETDAFLMRLRRLDFDPSSPTPSSSTSEPPVERYTSRMIRRLNDTAKEREGQVRELLACEKEFRKIGSGIGGNDVLGSLEALEEVEGLIEDEEKESSDIGRALSATSTPLRSGPAGGHLQPLSEEEDEEDEFGATPDGDGDSDDDVFVSGQPPSRSRRSGGRPRRQTITSGLPPSPPSRRPGAPTTPRNTLPHLAHMRSVTSSLVNSLGALSEHAQENSAATADAGRKLRALRNRVAGWRSDYESAERSRERIEVWEADAPRRVDGRKIVEEQLNAFRIVLAEANVKTQAIMAAA